MRVEPRRLTRALIAGAGIAGLTLALALANKGVESIVFERAAKLEPFGAGLQLSPNATRVLARLGLLDAIAPRATAPARIRVLRGRYEKDGNYQIVEIAGLYWHFVDLVWVFIFALFYLW